MTAASENLVTLREITQANFVPVVKLAVREDQKNFVATNVYSIAESKVYPENTPLAVYAGETLVGFVMYGYWAERDQHYINRVMIAQEFQGKGYGKAAMRLLIERMIREYGCNEIYLSYAPENSNARALYMKLGFMPTGAMEEGEEVACLKLAGTAFASSP